MSNSDGLGDLWKEVVESIEELSLSGCYERVNQVMSLGLLNALRRRTASQVEGSIILDAGAGPGTSTRTVLEVHPNAKVIMLDPSGPMLSMALSRLSNERVVAVIGRFESLPLPDRSVDGIVAMFSYRDAVSYSRAAEEFSRVLRDNGTVSILDFYRPAQPWKTLLKIYIMIIIPIALLLTNCGIKINIYKGFLETIDRMLTRKEIINLFSKYFKEVKFRRIVPGLGILKASRPERY